MLGPDGVSPVISREQTLSVLKHLQYSLPSKQGPVWKGEYGDY